MKKLLVFSFVFLLLIVKVINDTNAVKINSLTIQNDKLEANQQVTILQISDVHNRSLDGKLDQLTELDPDLIVLTGDLIDRQTTDLTNTKNLLNKLVTMERPIYFVSGNHEQDSAIFTELKAILAGYGVIELENRYVTIDVDGIPINLVGVANESTGHAQLTMALENIDLSLPTILLSHTPITPADALDLILSGHTHGGQVRLPFIGGIIAPDQGFFPKYDKGLYQLESGAKLYIDSGLGTSMLPIRFLNEAQVSMVTIESID